jgi:hypothetical protein
MTAGFGVDKGADGSGTNSSDIRKIFGSLYTPGVISGCEVVLSPTAMTYTVKPGVVAIQTAVGETVLAPVAETTVTTANGPSTGTRTDILYVQQRYPSIEGDANIVIGVGSTVPTRALELKQFTVPAGATKSNLAVATNYTDYSIPYGATLGQLHYYNYPSGIGDPLPGFQRFGHASFNLPTDRRLRFKVFAVLGSLGASGFDNSKYCEYGFIPYCSSAGGDFVLWSTGGLHQAWQTHYFESSIDVPAGPCDVNLIFTKIVGPGTPVVYRGGGGDGYGRRGIEFYVEDAGPVK